MERQAFSGIERRLDRLRECLNKLEPFRDKARDEFDKDPYLRDIVERNLEVAIQCCIDMAHRIISIEEAVKPTDYYEGFIILGQMKVLPIDFSKKIATMAGFRNILVHEYVGIDWDEVYRNLQSLSDLYEFAEFVRGWMKRKVPGKGRKSKIKV
jgi:uncharacterized protein YutE (UPF0331/DUF86 family)